MLLFVCRGAGSCRHYTRVSACTQRKLQPDGGRSASVLVPIDGGWGCGPRLWGLSNDAAWVYNQDCALLSPLPVHGYLCMVVVVHRSGASVGNHTLRAGVDDAMRAEFHEGRFGRRWTVEH